MKEKILSYLLLKKEINFWEMVPRMGYLPDFVALLKKMEKEKLIEIRNSKIILTEKGKKSAIEKNISPKNLPGLIPQIKINKELLKKYRKLRKRIFPKEKFDQLQITEKGVVRKIEVMRFYQDLEKKEIICLGDDDMVGIALALTGLPKKITILDIDEEILEYEKKILDKLGYKNSVFYCDFLKTLPKKFKKKYDVFITEPPDTINGITLFFSRGIDALKKEGGVSYLGICINDLPEENILQIEKNILKMKGLITDMFPKLQEYIPSKEDFEWVKGLPREIRFPRRGWFFSDLLRIKILKGAVPLIKGNVSKTFQKKFIKTKIYC